MQFGKRRGVHVVIAAELDGAPGPLDAATLQQFESLDLLYRSLVAILYNFAPQSGHPGGSISSGRIAQALLFDGMAYDLGDPLRQDADVLSYAAGHKALGLYALWALRDELAALADPGLLPAAPKHRLRLEDLLGFRRNPAGGLPLFKALGARALDGHPTPATPFVRLATGASGVGLAASTGLALAAADRYGRAAPVVHVLEGEGGLTPGRVAEALATAGTASLGNLVLHVDWNQASIDSDRVCREGPTPGDYVQWTPAELCWLHDWNVIEVAEGHDFQHIVAAQRRAAALDNGQPTAIVYRTVKGWQYGLEGRRAHGAGHKLCSPAFQQALEPLRRAVGTLALPTCDLALPPCRQDQTDTVLESCCWQALLALRAAIISRRQDLADFGTQRLRAARERLQRLDRQPRPDAPDAERIFPLAAAQVTQCPPELRLQPGQRTTLRGELGRVLGWYNRQSGGAVLVAAADLLGSTSVQLAADGFPPGFWNLQTNPASRVLATGGICEDAMAGVLAGASAYGHHVGVGASYGAFLAALGHVAARLHAIGCQARREVAPEPNHPFLLVCAHAGLKTGEDGPTHADPQALQLLQENFPAGSALTLTPWDPQELWPLLSAALARRPAVIAPFVTRPDEPVLDRAALGLAPPEAAVQGVYRLRTAEGPSAGTLVLQGSAVTYAFLTEALPELLVAGVDLDVYYVASAELFDALPVAEQERIFPEARGRTALGITDFTLPTLYRFVTSARGRAASLHPFRGGRFLGSGQGPRVLAEAGLDGPGQVRAILGFFGWTQRAGAVEPVLA